jgi:thiol-disulfide isomerase/thioredoxin
VSRPIVLGLVLTLTAACKSALPSDAKTTVMSFPDLDCSDCGETMARDLIEEDGVFRTAFDKHRVELTVVADPKVDAFALAQSKKPADEEWHLVLGAGKGAYLPWQPAPRDLDVSQIAKDGEDIPDLAPFIAKGKVTLMDFSAKWCEPCRRMDEHVLGLLATRRDLAYRKLDVGDWDTPLTAHWLAGVSELRQERRPNRHRDGARSSRARRRDREGVEMRFAAIGVIAVAVAWPSVSYA